MAYNASNSGMTEPIALFDMLHEDFIGANRPNTLEGFRQVWTALMSSAVPAMTILYIVSQNWIRKRFDYGEHYQKNKSWWKKIMFSYNIGLSIFSLGVFIVCAEALLRLPIRTHDCDLWFREAPAFVWAVYLFYLSKFVEYADTFFILIMQKKGQTVTWLQYLHHIGAAIDVYVLYITRGEPAWIFVTFNSFIHTIMYVYYAGAVYGKKFLPKQAMTTMQITQFLWGQGICFNYKNIPCFRNDPYRLAGAFYVSNAYVSMVFLLFANFFIVNYIAKKSKDGGEEGAVKAVKSEKVKKVE